MPIVLQDVQSRQSMGIHCATFVLTDEAGDDPPRELVKAVAAKGMPAAEFVTLQHGAILRTGTKLMPDDPPLLGHD